MGTEDGRVVYDVEFYVGNKEYDYEIDAKTGEILKKDTDIENDIIVKVPSKTQNTNTNYISREKAKSIALNHAEKTGSTVNFVKTELDYEDGRKVYDVEFHDANKEYSYEIDAKTGTILKYEVDNVDFD